MSMALPEALASLKALEALILTLIGLQCLIIGILIRRFIIFHDKESNVSQIGLYLINMGFSCFTGAILALIVQEYRAIIFWVVMLLVLPLLCLRIVLFMNKHKK